MKFRQAILTDAERIGFLNNCFYHEFLGGKKDRGFLKNSFTIDEIKAIMLANEIVVSEFEGAIIGYYLVNSFHRTKTVEKREVVIKGLIAENKIPDGKCLFNPSCC